MIGGYREDPDQANHRREGRRILIVSVAMALAVMAGFELFKDVLIASLGLTKSGYIWLSNLSWFLVLITTQQMLLRRSIRRLQTPPS